MKTRLHFLSVQDSVYIFATFQDYIWHTLYLPLWEPLFTPLKYEFHFDFFPNGDQVVSPNLGFSGISTAVIFSIKPSGHSISGHSVV